MERISAYRIYWACECVERQAGDCDVLHLDDQEYYIVAEADRYIAGLKNQIPRWRDVYEEPPEEGDLVIVRFEERHPGNYFPKDIVRWNSSYILGEIKVTGWMPVPEG